MPLLGHCDVRASPYLSSNIFSIFERYCRIGGPYTGTIKKSRNVKIRSGLTSQVGALRHTSDDDAHVITAPALQGGVDQHIAYT